MPILATGIHYRLNSEQAFRGPFSEEEVLGWYRSGRFTSETTFRFGAEDTVVTLNELCGKNGSASPFSGKKEHTQHEAHVDSSHEAQLRRMQEQIDSTNRLLHSSVERCTKLEQIVSSVVERFLLFSGELSDVKAEWKSIRNTPLITGASPSVTSSTTTLASAASSSSSLNLLMQLKEDMNALENVLRGGKDHDEESRRNEFKGEEERSEGGGGGRGAGDILLRSPSPLSGRSEVKRVDSGVSTASTAKRTNSSEEDDGDETMMETVDEQLEAAAKQPLLYHLPTTVLPTAKTTTMTAVEYSAVTHRLSTLENGLREAMDRIEEMKAADLSHVLESIDRVSEELSAGQNEIKTQRALDRGSQLVIEDAVEALKKDRTLDQERLTEVERFMGRIMTGTEATDDLLTAKKIRSELKAAKERDEFTELRLYGIDDKLRRDSVELERTNERLSALEEAMTKMLTLDSFKSMLSDHADELSSQMKKTSAEVSEVVDRVDRVEQTTSQLSVHVDEISRDFDEVLGYTQSSGAEYEFVREIDDENGQNAEEFADDEEGSVATCIDADECACSMCREGKTPKVISDLLNGHRGNFDQARIATRADLIDIRDALSVRRRRSSFVEDTRHFFGEGVRCDHCDVTIREGVSLLSHVSSERHAQSTCILKEDLRFWWNRIHRADE